MTLSIIVPVYNVAAYLKPCLDSIAAAAQYLTSHLSHPASACCRSSLCSGDILTPHLLVEVICVDDGSTDGSGEILDQYANNLLNPLNPLNSLNLRILHQQNAGVSAARNAALDAATGDWIGFVDADDTVSERWLEVVVTLIKTVPAADAIKVGPLIAVRDRQASAGSLRFDRKCVDEQTAVLQANSARITDVRRYEGSAACAWALRQYSRHGWPMQNFIRRNVIGSARFPLGVRLKEDICFFLNLASRISYAVAADFPGYFYTVRIGSALHRLRSDEDSLKFVEEMLKTGRKEPRGFCRAVSVAIGYEFVQWAEERDQKLPYDPKTCPIRAAWRKAWDDGLIDLGDMPFFWRPCIRIWLKTGWLWPAKWTRRLRESVKFIR